MSKSGIPPRQIISSLRQDNPMLPAISKTIYNAKTKIRKENLGGHSVIQALLGELGKGGFMYDILNEGGHLTHLFFAHPLSVKLTDNFPSVFVMDSTYKTNRYKMPLLDIIGISGFNTSFYSAFAFLKRECLEDYIWALKMFSKILGEKKPSVIITDREFALINAIKIVFPNCTHLLCVWHIEKNLETNCKKYFESEEKWVDFLGFWTNIVYSSTEYEYNELWREFESSYGEKKTALEYIASVWLPLKEKFVGAWTDEFLHFRNRVSSRAESAHAKLKKYLQVSTGDLYEVRSKICLAIQHEFNEIKVRLSTEKMHILHICNTAFFKNVFHRVSLYALKEIHKQYMKVKLNNVSPVCSGRFTKTMGLPCAHKMANWRNEALSFDLIHSQWQIDGRYLSASATTQNDDQDDGFSVMLEELCTKYQEWPISEKNIAREKISELLNQSNILFEPNIRPPKGRPPNSKNKRKIMSSTLRDPSGFEFVEASRQCGSRKGSDSQGHLQGDYSEECNTIYGSTSAMDANPSFFDLNVSSYAWE